MCKEQMSPSVGTIETGILTKTLYAIDINESPTAHTPEDDIHHIITYLVLIGNPL